LKWLPTEGIVLAQYGPRDHLYEELSIERLLAAYFGIDLEVIEREKRAMLDETQEASVGGRDG
jgi:hypothetical protein